MIEFLLNMDFASFLCGALTVIFVYLLLTFVDWLAEMAFRKRAMRRDLEERFNQIDDSLEVFYKHLRAIERRFPGEGDLTDD